VGREVFMDVHVFVDAELSVIEGHAICSDVERAIAQSMERPINVVVHCEPAGPTGTG
jgi:divalent metal cation (Fe/Co/Zn/Cd) transporter